MRREEFLKELSRMLGDYSKKNECLNYYDEIIYDRTMNGEREEDVINSFGDASKIVEKITGKVVENKKIVYTERVDARKEEPREVHIEKKEYDFSAEKTERKINIWKVLVIIILFPTIISILVGLVSGIFGLAGGLLAGGAGSIVASVIALISSAFNFIGGVSIAQIGICLMIIALGITLLVLGINFIILMVKLIKKFVSFICEQIRGGFFYEG